MVERFFRDLTQNPRRRGVFRDVAELIMAIGDYIDRHNERPKPFVWTAKACDILEKVKGARKALEVADYYHNGKRWWVRLHEKGGKRHEVPCHHNAEAYLDAYL